MTHPQKPAPPAALLAAVERSLEPYKRLFPAETIDWMREEALAQLAAHPYPAALLRALESPRATAESHVRAEGDGDPGAAPARPGRKVA